VTLPATAPLVAGNRGVPPAITAAVQAVELAGYYGSEHMLRCAPIAHLVTADCIEAVAFSYLAESDSALHAHIERLCLGRLCRNEPSFEQRGIQYQSAPAA
jgi:hypothetical protein